MSSEFRVRHTTTATTTAATNHSPLPLFWIPRKIIAKSVSFHDNTPFNSRCSKVPGFVIKLVDKREELTVPTPIDPTNVCGSIDKVFNALVGAPNVWKTNANASSRCIFFLSEMSFSCTALTLMERERSCWFVLSILAVVKMSAVSKNWLGMEMPVILVLPVFSVNKAWSEDMKRRVVAAVQWLLLSCHKPKVLMGNRLFLFMACNSWFKRPSLSSRRINSGAT